MKKTNLIVGLVVLVVLAGGSYALLSKSSSSVSSTTSGKTTTHSKTPSVNNAILVTKTDSKLGQYLATPGGKTLYTYNGDTKDVSNCTGSCLVSWPAYVDTGSISNLPVGVSTIKRTDNGQFQYTYNGLPLYYFVSDSTGKVTGDGIDNFSVAKPAAASSSSSSSTTPSSNSSSSTSTDNSSSQSSNYNY